MAHKIVFSGGDKNLRQNPSAVCGLSLVAASRGSSIAVVHGLLVAVASLVAELRLYGTGFSNCGSQV